VRITSVSSNPPSTGTKGSALQFICSVKLMILIVSSPLFFSPGLIQAEDSDGPESHIYNQEDRTDTRIPITDSHPAEYNSALNPFIENEVHCLAMNIYFEARGESKMGQQAVGHVVMNRVEHSTYPDSVCEVVHQGGEKQLYRCQFSWWCDGLPDKPVDQKAWRQSFQLALNIYLGHSKDTTDGALWYHAAYVTPYWSKKLLQGPRIGQHIFYLENRRNKSTL